MTLHPTWDIQFHPMSRILSLVCVHLTTGIISVVQILIFFIESERNHDIFVAKRDACLKDRSLTHANLWTGSPTFWDHFAPTTSCPFALRRLGKVGDGGKWICGLKEIAKKPECVAYSFGVAGETSFEQELLDTTNCTLYAFDPTVPRISLDVSKYPGRVHFYQVGLGTPPYFKPPRSSVSFPVKRLKQFMSELNHDWIDVFKVDVEHAEYEAMDDIIDDFPNGLPFPHVNIEVHLHLVSEISEEVKQFDDLLKWWLRLEKAGLRAYMNEMNYLGGIAKSKVTAVEYAFLNIKPFISGN